MAKGYRYISHTADVEFVASGGTIEETFRNALLALFDTVSYAGKVSRYRSKARTFALREKAKDTVELLWYTLQDALSLLDANGVFAYAVSGLKITKSKTGYSLAAKLHAKDRKDEYSKLDAKGVSGYDLSVKKNKGRFIARVVIDV